MKGNPWAARFDVNLEDAAIDVLLEQTIPPITDLMNMPDDLAVTTLREAFKRLHVPTAQARAVFRRLVAAAHAYALEQFPDAKTFLQRTYACDEPLLCREILCITGLAGLGKTLLMAAFNRAYGTKQAVAVSDHGNFPFVGCWRIVVKPNVGLTHMLRHFFRHPEDIKKGEPIELLLRRELAAQGVCALLPDEFQFLSQSSANTLVAKRLLQLAALGPPLAFVANFSLVWRLLRRPNEERERLLPNPIVMVPDKVDSEDWARVVAAMIAVAPEFSRLTVRSAGSKLHRYTFGIKRALASILCLAYGRMRARRAAHVELIDIEAAYGCASYTSTRIDVEELWSRSITGTKRRDDLSNPFAGTMIGTNFASEQQRERQASEAALRGALSASERKAVHPPPAAPSPKLKRRKTPTADELLAAAARFGKKTDGE